jgi:serine/threonine protein kinase
VKLLVDIAEAVKHAHDHDVIHRDIKPENIVCRLNVDARHIPFLTDFDLAWFSTRTQTATQHALGVIAYAAPEQYSAFDAKASNAKTPALDVFSFGQLLFFCFVGKDPDPVRLPLNLEVLQKAVAGIGSNEFVRQIGSLYKDATEWNPIERIQNFDEVVRRLMRVLDELEQTDTDVILDEDAFLSELIYQLTRDPREPGEPTFTSRSGNWIVYLTWHRKTWRKETVPSLTVEFVPQGRIGLNNVSNEQMRKMLNDRVNTKLRHHKPYATLRKGTHGTYQLFVDCAPIDFHRSGVEPAAEAIRSTLEGLEA